MAPEKEMVEIFPEELAELDEWLTERHPETLHRATLVYVYLAGITKDVPGSTFDDMVVRLRQIRAAIQRGEKEIHLGPPVEIK